jgi:chlorophyll synthase
MFGIGTAAWIYVLMIDIFQAGVAVYLISIKENLYGVILLLMVIPQIYFSGYVFSQKPSRK